MDMLSYIKRVQAIAQAGLTYGENAYDYERYEELRELSAKMLSELSNESLEKIKIYFTNGKGYQTPKVDVRAVCIKNNKLLLVQERIDGRWSLPGGWCDVGYSPSQMAIKEVYEEGGFEVEVKKLLALYDKECHGHPKDIYHVYKLFFYCEIIGGEKKTSIETSQVDFFDFDNLPPLSETRNTREQIMKMRDLIENPKDADFD